MHDRVDSGPITTHRLLERDQFQRYFLMA